jgi:ubiquitin-protein ligase
LLPQFDNFRSMFHNYLVFCFLVWHGVIFIKDGVYKNGIFKFVVTFALDYPKTFPKIIFNSKVFHPLISINSGELDLSVMSNLIHHTLGLMIFAES